MVSYNIIKLETVFHVNDIQRLIGQIGSAVLTFIDDKQTNSHPDKKSILWLSVYRYLDR